MSTTSKRRLYGRRQQQNNNNNNNSIEQQDTADDYLLFNNPPTMQQQQQDGKCLLHAFPLGHYSTQPPSSPAGAAPASLLADCVWFSGGNRVEQKSRWHVAQGGPEIRNTPRRSFGIMDRYPLCRKQHTVFNVHIGNNILPCRKERSSLPNDCRMKATGTKSPCTVKGSGKHYAVKAWPARKLIG